jgi:amino acid adenylation domain-containing protein
MIFGILKIGAAYVPVDADSPTARAAYILNNCRVRVVLTEASQANELRDSLLELGACPVILCVADGASAESLEALLNSLETSSSVPDRIPEDSLAYILYTSGSTGNPKGVMLSHANALSFVDWCSETFRPHAEDRVSSHAPFHFDLSIFDLYVSIKHGATIVLIGEALGKEAMRLAQVISAEEITIWYSTPSILGLLARYGKMKRYGYSRLRLVLFAGEVFPVRQYVALRGVWAHPRFFNLYGPTETNVCTWYEVPDDPAVSRMSTFPIGRICSPNQAMVVDDHGESVKAGGAGELLISGPNVMRGYWELPEKNAHAFLVDSRGTHWYRTGDIVTEGADGFHFVGRRDRMVKRRGYRVELGEIEVGLLGSGELREAAVVAVHDSESGVRITAFVSGGQRTSLGTVALKSLSMRHLPPYMIPDSFVVLPAVPRTSTDKVDYEELKRVATQSR